MKLHTDNYLKKYIVSRLFSEKMYHKIKLYKIVFDYLIGKDYENSRNLLPKLVKSNSTILDIGGNMGQYACRLSSLAKMGKIYSFEPHSLSYEALVSMKKILGLKNVVPLHSAVSDKKGQLKLVIPVIDGNLIVGTQAVLKQYQKSEFEETKYIEEIVESTTIDDFVLENDLKEIDLIKIDTEGAEVSVLRGGFETIKKFLPALIVEISPESEELVLLSDLGYESYIFTKNEFVSYKSNSNTFSGGNTILINKNKK